jgi:hypothetical protein
MTFGKIEIVARLLTNGYWMLLRAPITSQLLPLILSVDIVANVTDRIKGRKKSMSLLVRFGCTCYHASTLRLST